MAEGDPVLINTVKVGVVIPVGPGRLDNLKAVLRSLEDQHRKPTRVVLVFDGDEAWDDSSPVLDLQPICPSIPLTLHSAPKHRPGMEQPRNAGVRMMLRVDKTITHVWFCDSDILLAPEAGDLFMDALSENPDRILVGPYEWMGPGQRAMMPDLKNDPRWPSFDNYEPDEVRYEDISAGLACFSGNLIWPVYLFARVGGFWSEIHHGRCEDGELGLRAVAMGLGISFIAEARGYHLDHPVNWNWKIEANARDVPMLNARHPWVEGEGLLVVEEDGKRFNCRCEICGWCGNTAEIWSHRASHGFPE